MKLIIDVPEEMYKNIKSGLWCGNNIISNAIEIGTPIPDNATNGEVIKSMFPNTTFGGNKTEINIGTYWWNAPYQKGGKE